MPKAATRPDKVDAIIGNESWTGCHCSVHGGLRTPVVDFPTDDEYGVALCVECVQDAVRVLRENGIQISEK